MGTISIRRTDDGLERALAAALEGIGGLSAYIKPGDRVLLKPNINGTEGATDLGLVEAIISLLRQMQPSKIAIGESSFGSAQITDLSFAKTGYCALAQKHGIDLINFNNSKPVEIAVKNPRVLPTIKIAAEVFEFDKIINIPVMKVHYATGITLALKNLKGIVPGGFKRHFHQIGLDNAIADLNNTIKPALTIADCICAMEKMGPRGGDPVPLNLIMAGRCSGELDYTGSRIMGFTLDEVQHLRYFLEDNSIDAENIETSGLSIEEAFYPFKKPKLATVIPRQFTLHESDACSSCMNALILSCQFLKKEPALDADVHLGSLGLENGSKRSIAFGTCAAKAHPGAALAIRGCPPYPFDLNGALETSG